MRPSEYLLRAHEAGIPKIESSFTNGRGGYCSIGVLGTCTKVRLTYSISDSGEYHDSIDRGGEEVVADLVEADPDLSVLLEVLPEDKYAYLVETYELAHLCRGDRIWEALVNLNDESVGIHEWHTPPVYLNFRELAHILAWLGG